MKKEDKKKIANELAEVNKQYSRAIANGEDTSVYRQMIIDICNKYNINQNEVH